MTKAALTGAAFFMTAAFYQGANAAPCGTLIIPSAIGQDDPDPVTSLNPLINNSIYNQETANLLYRPLIWIGQNGQADPDRSLAQLPVQAFDNGTRFLITLKPWRWSDGLPVTADDLLFGFHLTQALGPVFAYAGQGGVPDRIAGVRAIDASHAEIRMTSPTDAQWFILAGLPFLYPLPRHAWAPAGAAHDADIGRDALWQRQTDPTLVQVVDGPFKLERFIPERTISYVPNPLYGGHKAEVARLVIDFLQGGSALHALRAGDIDMAQIRPVLWDSVGTPPHTYAKQLPPSFGYRSLIFNLKQDRTPFFRDARVRRALTDAADQKTIIDVVYRGTAQENRVPIPAEATQFRSPAVAANRLPVRTDRALAAAELDAAGWRMGPDGVREKDGVQMVFTALFVASEADTMEVMQILQQDYRALGILMRIRPLDFNQVMATSQGNPADWDAVVYANTLTGYPDGTGFYDAGGANNPGSYSNPQMDALIHASTAANGMAALFRYQDFFASEQPVNILPEGGFRLLVSDRVHGVDDFVNAQNFISPEYLSVDDAACPSRYSDAGR
jgi:peptide/nickel transport system substrate-binding protein